KEVSWGADRSVGAKDLRLKKQSRNETFRAPTPRALPTDHESQRRRAMAARRILGEIEVVRACSVGNGGFTASDRAELAITYAKLERLYAQLRLTGWQEERAG